MPAAPSASPASAVRYMSQGSNARAIPSKTIGCNGSSTVCKEIDDLGLRRRDCAHNVYYVKFRLASRSSSARATFIDSTSNAFPARPRRLPSSAVQHRERREHSGLTACFGDDRNRAWAPRRRAQRWSDPGCGRNGGRPSIDISGYLRSSRARPGRPRRRGSRSRAGRPLRCRLATDGRSHAGRARAGRRRNSASNAPSSGPASAAARSTAYSLPIPPKSISMPGSQRDHRTLPADAPPARRAFSRPRLARGSARGRCHRIAKSGVARRK